jgi:hypothetical protein
MSKIQIKKELQKLTKEQLVELTVGLYDNCKPSREYFNVFLNPGNFQESYEKYKAVIVNKFKPERLSWNIKTCFSVSQKAIADFSALNPPPKLLADLLVTLAELGCGLSSQWGDMPEHHYTNTSNSFERALKFLKKKGLLDEFTVRCKKCLKKAIKCGGGFSDEMTDIFCDYYQ